jgi:hypothetical protein
VAYIQFSGGWFGERYFNEPVFCLFHYFFLPIFLSAGFVVLETFLNNPTLYSHHFHGKFLAQLEAEHTLVVNSLKKGMSTLQRQITNGKQAIDQLQAQLSSSKETCKTLSQRNQQLQQQMATEKERNEERFKCCICMDGVRDTLIMPCMHFLYCNACMRRNSATSNNCPACRTNIQGLLKCHTNY